MVLYDAKGFKRVELSSWLLVKLSLKIKTSVRMKCVLVYIVLMAPRNGKRYSPVAGS